MDNPEDIVDVPDPKLENELRVVESRTGLGEMPDNTLDDFGFAVNRLHDPCNYDHTSIDSMLATYYTRDLEKSKIFRIAKKIFGDKMDAKYRMRTRTFNLTGLKDGCPVISGNKGPKSTPDSYSIQSSCVPRVDDEDDDLVDMNDLRLRVPRPQPTYQAGSNPTDKQDLISEEKIEEYHQWLDDHKQMRANIANIGLTEDWLLNKPGKSVMENLLYEEMLDKRKLKYAHEMAILEAERLAAEKRNTADCLPRIRRPSPLAIRKLDAFLRTHKLRLIDIFSAIDKDKNWNLSREEFKSAIVLYGMDISNALLEDLITTLDVDRSGEVSYKELVKGLELYQKEKRDVKNKGLSMIEDEDPEEDSGSRSPGLHSPHARSVASSRLPSGKTSPSKSGSKPGSASTRRSKVSSATTRLETPDMDLQESRLVMSSTEQQVDLRKRDKNFLHYYNKEQQALYRAGNRDGYQLQSQPNKATVFKTGYKPIDDHCKPSRLEGQTGEMVNAFRQLKLKEYHNIRDLCETEGVTLSRKLLDKVLLHPGDKTTKMMLKQGIRQPGADLPLSRHFAEPPKRPRTPIEIRFEGRRSYVYEDSSNKGKIKRDKDGKLMIDYKHKFRSRARAAPSPTRVQLSTGMAMVARKVDCWMTFEEYEAMTKPFYSQRYVEMRPGTNGKDLTWPGYMLDKMRVYLDNDHTSESSNAVFHGVKHQPHSYHGYDNDLNNWQVSDAGYLKQGDLRHPKKFYDTSNLEAKFKPDLTYRNHLVHKNTAQHTMHTKQTLSVPHS